MFSAKVPAALFLVAATVSGVALARHDAQPDEQPLPDPQEMLAGGYGYLPLDEVVAMWRDRVREDPRDYLSRVQLGQSLLGLARETGDLSLYERAEAHLQRAADQAPGYPSAQIGLAASLSAQHEFAAANDILEREHQSRPFDLGLVAAIADAQLELGNYDQAFAGFDELAEGLPDNPATLARLAREAALTGHNDVAVGYARRALILSADLGLRPSASAGSWFQLAYYQYQAGEAEDAEDSLRSGLEIDPEHLASRELLGKVLVAQGRLDEAAALYEDILSTSQGADLNGLLAEIYEAQGRHEEAEEQVRLGLDLAAHQVDRYPAERRHLAGFYADNDPEAFLELAEEDVATRRDVYGLDLLAWALHLNGRDAEALATEREALALGTQDAVLLYHAGMIEAAAGEGPRARVLLESALDLNPGFDLGDVARAHEVLDSL
jgi:tetratricopeptide (TPR) repeat protein